MSYKHPFFEAPREERQFYMKHGFNFICDCKACEEDWPTMENVIVNNLREIEFIEPEIIDLVVSDDWISKDIKYDQKTIKTIGKTLTKAMGHLKHPSRALMRLQFALYKAFTKFYIDY